MRAEFSQGSFHDAVAVSSLGDICVLEESVGPASGDFFGESFSGLVDVRDGNRGAFAGEQQGRCSADARCGAGDERDLAREGWGRAGESHWNGFVLTAGNISLSG